MYINKVDFQIVCINCYTQSTGAFEHPLTINSVHCPLLQDQ